MMGQWRRLRSDHSGIGNGQQHGPVNFEQLKSLFANRTVNRDSLVWKQGMSEWAALKDVEELKAFLGGSTPPPLPGA